jgi:ABC-2 type transport system ATP-binding protein
LPSLEAINLSKKYGSFYAVSDLNLKIEGAKCVGFLGPNGAGKTTTINMLITLLKPTEGTASVLSFDISKQHDDVRKVIGVVPQEYTADSLYSCISYKKFFCLGK